MNWVVYMLECSDGSLYTGVTPDLELRIFKHSMGKASKYTRSRRPIRLAWTSLYMGKRAALRLERAIKAMSRAEKLDLILRTSYLPLPLQKTGS